MPALYADVLWRRPPVRARRRCRRSAGLPALARHAEPGMRQNLQPLQRDVDGAAFAGAVAALGHALQRVSGFRHRLASRRDQRCERVVVIAAEAPLPATQGKFGELVSAPLKLLLQAVAE